ncbi:PREDICTED: protein kinase 2B, chloroplastic-like [Camelina sativa]|uniref:Protein kinase 2B, chloroplastic-like n=1 Tax=Camelina sativa TaxID=90675 RepID=A0ABM1QWA4_CAMSA|nr:PREDICTED: protein kinase 2B, chloroplastic-like [Camelina sativa]
MSGAHDPQRISAKRSPSSRLSSITIQQPCCSDDRSFASLQTPRREGELLASPTLKAFTFNELKTATRNFRPNSVIGEGGFGYVYKGWIDERTLSPSKPGSGMVVAVKKLKEEGFQGHRQWLLDIGRRVITFGFWCKSTCQREAWRIISLDVKTCPPSGAEPIPWRTRMKVAISAARGLAFLHDAQVIYRDFKASNILLDSEFNAKLSDLGLAKEGPTGDRTHVSTQVMGTHLGRMLCSIRIRINLFRCYAASEYVATGRITTKSDVYSFGVVLLELLSGRPTLDKSKVGVERNLVDWAKPYLGDKRKVFRIMDTKLGGQYSHKGACLTANTALQCLNQEAKLRPNMSDVLSTLEEFEIMCKSGSTSKSVMTLSSSSSSLSATRRVRAPLADPVLSSIRCRRVR